MTDPGPGPTLTDQAAHLVRSSQTCRCGADAHRAGGPDLNAMIDDLVPIQQREDGCTCGPPCDGTNVEDDMSDGALNAMLERLKSQYRVLEDEVTAAACDCAGRHETPEPEQQPQDSGLAGHSPTVEEIEENRRQLLEELFGTPTPPRGTGARVCIVLTIL
jgi:hypothetical protein